MLTVLNIILLVLNAVFIGVAVYLSTYLKKKAEHLATREDFEQLRVQTAALRQTTKEIEAKISNDVWDRQKRWELKREVLFAAMRRVANTFEALKSLENMLQTELKNPSVVTNEWKGIWIAKNDRWFKVSAALNESFLFVQVTSGNEMQDAILKYKNLTTSIAAKIHKKDGVIFRQSVPDLIDLQERIRIGIRRELRIDESITLQSTGSSAVPGPAAPNP